MISKFITKYKNMPKPVKASFWYTICSILQKSITFITLPIFTRLLTSGEYGSYNVYQTWFNIIIIFTTLNLQYGSFSTAMTKFEEDRDRYISSIQGLSTVITLLLFALYIPFRGFVNDATELTTMFMLAMCIEMIVQPAFGFWSGKKRFDFDYKNLVIVTLMNSVLNPILGILMVLGSDDKVFAKIYSGLIIQVVLFGTLYFINFIRGKAFFVKQYWKFALQFNIPLIPYYLSQIVFNQSDRLMIAKICGKDKAGIYSVAYSLSLVLNFVITAVNNSFVPWKYKKLKNKDTSRISRVSCGISAFVMVMLLMLILCAPEVIRIMADEEYYAARWVVPPVAASVFFLFLTQLFINIEFFFEEKSMLVAGSILSALVNIGLNALFIPKFGFVAAGYTTLFSYLLFALCNYVCAIRVLKKHWPEKKISQIYNIKLLFLMSAVFLILMVGCTLLYDYMVIRYGIVAIVLVLAVVFRKKLLEFVRIVKRR